MITTFRTHQKKLAIIIAVVVIIAFGWLYNSTDLEKVGLDQIAKAYGKTVYKLDYEKGVRKFGVALDLGLTGITQDLTSGASSFNDAADRFVFNNIVVQHEADALGVSVPDSEVADRIRSIPFLMTNGTFDSTKYQLVLAEILPSRGFSERDFESLIRDEIRVSRLREIVGSAAWVPPSEISLEFENRYGKIEVAVLRFPVATDPAATTVTDEEISAFFDEQSEHLTTEEKRDLEFARFELSEADAALQGADKVKALQKVSNAAADFAISQLEAPADFEAAAKAAGATTGRTGLFAGNTPPTVVAEIPGALPGISRLTKAEPIADPLQVPNGFVVFRLAEIEVPRPLTKEEAAPKIRERLTREKALADARAKATTASETLLAAMESGTEWTAAVAAAGLQAETLAPFSRMEPSPEADFTILEAATKTPTGELSAPVEIADAVVLVHVIARQDPDPAAFEAQKIGFTARMENSKERTAFQEWLRLRRQAAKIEMLRQPG